MKGRIIASCIGPLASTTAHCLTAAFPKGDRLSGPPLAAWMEVWTGLQDHADTFAQFGKLANTLVGFFPLTPRFFREFPMFEIAVALTAWRTGPTTMQLTPGIVEERRLLAGRAFARLCPTPPSWPIRAKQPFAAHSSHHFRLWGCLYRNCSAEFLDDSYYCPDYHIPAAFCFEGFHRTTLKKAFKKSSGIEILSTSLALKTFRRPKPTNAI